ncbi:fimbrillin family protein [Parabacteroides distasonis]|uniref:fimbrillin family protein n=1 Tax=Parabacteroides distasonis TaxID=823 RepID=UPI002165A0A1|nr:fimbrillin family protein [Parabacteroides distasonis]MCS2604403.1 fimbrillin family protein [Parabacteroides distasonis]
MKKFLFLGIAATAMFASCTNDEMVEMNPQSAIGFETFVDKSTRATDVTKANLTAFEVYGWRTKDATEQIFDAQAVTANNGVCTYSSLQYWVGGYKYDFEAVAPKSGEKGVTVNDTYGASTITFASDSETDLIYASASKDLSSYDYGTLAAAPGVVDLTFGHLLSRVKFTFINGADANSVAKIAVTDVKITNAGTTGVYTPSNGTWAAATETGEVTFASTNITGIDGGESGETEHKYLIPYNVKDYSVSFTVTMTQGSVSDSFNYTVKLPETTTLVKGNSYNFKATFNPGQPIVFTADVTPWNDFTDVTIP